VNHPERDQLALFAGGDVGWLDRFRVRSHMNSCEQCREQIEQYRESAMALRTASAELPERLDWNRLAAEMTANIHLGLEAGECVTRVRPKAPAMGWRAAAAMASLCAVLGAAWWLNPPVRQVPVLRGPHVEIRTTSAGLELNENGNTLVLLHTRGSRAERPLIVSAPGTLRARYVDADTGQITINNVYSE
jgi:hypothetical protein